QLSLLLKANDKTSMLDAKLQALTKRLNQSELEHAKLIDEIERSRSKANNAANGSQASLTGGQRAALNSTNQDVIQDPSPASQRIGKVGFRSAPAPTQEER